MERRMSATEARVHFGELLRRVEAGETIVVERGGAPTAVVVSIEEYQRIHAGRSGTSEPAMPDWWEQARRSRERIAEGLGGRALDITQIINEMRDDRDEQLLENPRRR